MTVRSSPCCGIELQTGIGTPFLEAEPAPGTTWLVRQASVRSGMGSSLPFRIDVVDDQIERVWPVWRASVGAGAVVLLTDLYTTVPAGLKVRFTIENPNSQAVNWLMLYGSILDGENPVEYTFVSTP